MTAKNVEKSVKAWILEIIKKQIVALSIIVFMICVLGCIVIMTYHVNADSEEAQNEKSIEVVKEDSVDTEVNTDYINENALNHYYNISTKVLNGKTFIETPDGIYVVENNSSDFKLITDGMYSLGAVGENGIYLCEYVNKADRYQYNLAYLNVADYSIVTLAEDIDLTNDNGASHYSDMYVEGKHLYVEGASSFTSFLRYSDTKIELESSENHIIHYDFPYSAVCSAGLVEAYMEGKNEDLIGDLNIDLGNDNNTNIKAVRDVMLTPYGALARKGWGDGVENKVYLIDYTSCEEKLVYDGSNNGGLRVGYNTYDDTGFYGLAFIDENKYAVVFCSWNGEYKELYKFTSDNTVFGGMMNMSIVNDWLYFFDYSDNLMKRISIKDYSIEEIK